MRRFPQQCAPTFCTVLCLSRLSSFGNASQSSHLYLPYTGPQWCPMLSVMMHFPWSPVSTYKSQQCCQNSRTASAESICKVSSWPIASSQAIQYPVILCCLWPLFATQSFFTAVLRITLISHQSASINSRRSTGHTQKKCCLSESDSRVRVLKIRCFCLQMAFFAARLNLPE